MRFAFFSQNARTGDAIGGQLAARVRAVRVAGHEAAVYLSEGSDLRPELRDCTQPAAPRDLWRHQQRRAELLEADAFIFEFGGDYPLLDLLPMLARRGKRIIFCYHGVTPAEHWPEADRGRLAPSLARRNWVWFADEVWADSGFIANELHQATGFPHDRIRVLPCCLEELSHATAVSAPPGRTVLFVGRLAANKDLATALRALPLLPSDVRIVCVGPNQDVYAEEAARLKSLARELGVAERFTIQGAVTPSELAGWYAAASAVILPSRHEGFGLPVLEGAAVGVPVITSQAGALPSTLGPAGLTFRMGDAVDFARQVSRVLLRSLTFPARRRVAIVSPRFGSNFAGGAERSLRLMGQALARRGYAVEVFTTCNQHDCQWANHLPAGTTNDDGLTVHRFPIDPFNAAKLGAACEEIRRKNGDVPPAVAEQYLSHSLGSEGLLKELERRRDEFDAILTGPYLFKLTYETARRFGEQALLVPCFHDEPFAFLPPLRDTYRHVGGYLYHTRAEMEWAWANLGTNHPRSTVAGTLLSGPLPCTQGRVREGCFQPTAASQNRGPETPPSIPPLRGGKPDSYLVYCGRFCPEKGLDQLLDWSAQVAERDPTFRLVLLGQGAMPLPKAPWLTSLGFVDETTKREVIAGSTALVNLSRNESLSIVLLEAWAAGVPVIGHADCHVVKKQIEDAQGGFAVRSYDEFAAAIAQLQTNADGHHRLGQQGRAFVAKNYQDAEAFADRLAKAVTDLALPLPELLREVGPVHAAQFRFSAWQPKLLKLLEAAPTGGGSRRVWARFAAVSSQVTAAPGSGSVLLPVRLTLKDGLPLHGQGLGRRRLWTQTVSAAGQLVGRPTPTDLHEVLRPGATHLLTLRVAVPKRSGRYRVTIGIGSAKQPRRRLKVMADFKLNVTANSQATHSPAEPFLAAARTALAKAQADSELPCDYLDITQGPFAPLKSFAKKKLLHNFRKGLVEPMARQQSGVNQQLLAAIVHLLEAVGMQQQATAIESTSKKDRELKQLRRRVAALEKLVGCVPQGDTQITAMKVRFGARTLPIAAD